MTDKKTRDFLADQIEAERFTVPWSPLERAHLSPYGERRNKEAVVATLLKTDKPSEAVWGRAKRMASRSFRRTRKRKDGHEC